MPDTLHVYLSCVFLMEDLIASRECWNVTFDQSTGLERFIVGTTDEQTPLSDTSKSDEMAG